VCLPVCLWWCVGGGGGGAALTCTRRKKVAERDRNETRVCGPKAPEPTARPPRAMPETAARAPECSNVFERKMLGDLGGRRGWATRQFSVAERGRGAATARAGAPHSLIHHETSEQPLIYLFLGACVTHSYACCCCTRYRRVGRRLGAWRAAHSCIMGLAGGGCSRGGEPGYSLQDQMSRKEGAGAGGRERIASSFRRYRAGGGAGERRYDATHSFVSCCIPYCMYQMSAGGGNNGQGGGARVTHL
jgi:hypothetical protein